MLLYEVVIDSKVPDDFIGAFEYGYDVFETLSARCSLYVGIIAPHIGKSSLHIIYLGNRF
jgi:hypothetical protein